MKYIVLSLLCVLSLTGCNATYRDGGSSVHVNDGYYGNGGFCPPGQGKKGNC